MIKGLQLGHGEYLAETGLLVDDGTDFVFNRDNERLSHAGPTAEFACPGGLGRPHFAPREGAPFADMPDTPP